MASIVSCKLGMKRPSWTSASTWNLWVSECLNRSCRHCRVSSQVCLHLPSPSSIRGTGPSVLRVLSDERNDGHRFVYAREFSPDVFLHCYRLAHQEIFGLLEVTTMVDCLMLRLRGAMQEPWMEDLPELRRCVVAGKVTFDELRGVVTELMSIW